MSKTTVILKTFVLMLEGPADPGPGNVAADADLQHRRFHELLREAEENLNDLLPAGYKVMIKEWDDA